ncbi:N-acetylmuramoyl-L-alanine amidase [Shouchella lehensis]|uniref:N-acetylmuramoyl-L-alanine amidase n=1 Tax=Shouchella lehensis TaxID=300825 RepID=A0A4Y7WDR5_9BACI|nr:N-acetylmuramoyl-L-alanine amidase [Shouchella lehensis]MBG9783599.1 hypothetical protein [Shouchella lehensis]TES45643.1 hypothetical protein E2L03_19865 [Shouchella lehensis]
MSKLICLDPGHAKNTPGKRAGSNPVFYEYASNRRVARLLAAKLKSAGFRTIYSCNLDSAVDLSLSQRGQNAVNANADLFVSIHTNAHADPNVRGTETFIHTNSQASLSVAQAVQTAMIAEFKQQNRGVKRANFGVLRATYQNMLSILTEADFFTNPQARAWMLTPGFDEAYSNALLRGICAHYGVSVPPTGGSAPAPSKPTEPKSDDIGSELLRVKAEKLWVYNKPDWNARTFQVSKGEAFTVKRVLIVNGSKMYELKSGLYITANTQFVEFDGVIASTPTKKTDQQLANEVRAGLHGNGEARKVSLGNRYEAVQAIINSKAENSIDVMAREVRAGIHGDGHENRRKSLGISQAQYEKVRARVNQLSKSK